MAACRELQDFERQITSGGFYEIGEICRRLGDLAAAEEAYGKANELGSDPQLGLALLRLAEGKIGAATAGITRSLEEAEQTPARLRRLPAQVEIGRGRATSRRPARRRRVRDPRRLVRRSAAAVLPPSRRSSTSPTAGSGSRRATPQARRRVRGRRVTAGSDLGAPRGSRGGGCARRLPQAGRRARRQAGARGRPGDVRADRRPARRGASWGSSSAGSRRRARSSSPTSSARRSSWRRSATRNGRSSSPGITTSSVNRSSSAVARWPSRPATGSSPSS